MKQFARNHPFLLASVLAVAMVAVAIAILTGGLRASAQAQENRIQTISEPVETVEMAAASGPAPSSSPQQTDYKLYGTFARAMAEDLQYPALTISEQERCFKLLNAYDEGERPASAAPKDPAQTGFAVVPLAAEQYDGLAQYVFLPMRTLADEELLQLIDAFAQRGERLTPETLDESNCMRGGCIEVNRNRTAEENERWLTLIERYKREGLRPQSKLSADPAQGSIATVSLNADAHAGLDSFTFYPLRRLSDEELLQLIDMGLKDSLYNKEGFEGNWESDEAKCRAIAQTLFDMETSAKLVYDGYTPGDAVRPDTYTAHFETPKQGGAWRWYVAVIDSASGEFIRATTSPEDDNLIVTHSDGTSVRESPDGNLALPKPDLKDAKWTDAAKAFVSARLANGRSIAGAEGYRECSYNAGEAVDVAVHLDDGSSYRIAVLQRNMEIANVEYYRDGLDVAKELANRG